MITRTTIANKLQCFGKGLRTIRASIGSGEKGEGRTTRACRQGPTVWYRDGDNLGQQQFGLVPQQARIWARRHIIPTLRPAGGSRTLRVNPNQKRVGESFIESGVETRVGGVHGGWRGLNNRKEHRCREERHSDEKETRRREERTWTRSREEGKRKRGSPHSRHRDYRGRRERLQLVTRNVSVTASGVKSARGTEAQRRTREDLS